jgi:uncharacterized membrane protein (DUF4010 family)
MQRDDKNGTRVAGIRTFTLLGLLGGIAGAVSMEGASLAAAMLIAAASTILVIGYARALHEQADATTAVAAILVLALGLLAGTGNAPGALAAAATTVLLLALRDELHGFVGRLEARDIKGLARFAVIALAVLPFLPNRALGPYGAWNPAHLWWVVVLVTGFSFCGYAANRMFGVRHGTIATAVIGGAYSSTAVTQTLSQRLVSRSEVGSESAGIVLASAVMYGRVAVLVGVLAPRFLAPLLVLIGPSLLVAALSGWWLYHRAPDQEQAEPAGNPVALLPALGFLLFVAFSTVVARWAQVRFGGEGVAILLLCMGALDVDAAIITTGSLPEAMISAGMGAMAIAGTIIANMTVKTVLVLVYARGKGAQPAAALVASNLISAIMIGVCWLS